MTQSISSTAAARFDLPGPLRYVPGTSVAAANPESALFAPASRTAPAKVCVIAELGVNHDGQLDRALYLVEAAARAGADAIKLQLFNPRHLLSNQARLAAYQSDPRKKQRGDASDVFDMLDKLRLSVEQMLTIKQTVRKLGLHFIVTAFSLEDIDALKTLEVDAVKVASPDAVNRPLLEKVASLGRPLIVSTGTCDLEELRFAAELLHDHDAGGCLLQCVSSYPAPPQDAALGAMQAIRHRYALPVGYSDHTSDMTMGALAVAAGACVLEKHLTYNRRAEGPDHAASFEPDTFAMYTSIARQAAAVVGPIVKTVRPVEADVRDVSRQSVCLKRDLPAGHVLGECDLTVRRPGTGIPAAHLRELVGKRLRQAVHANNLLCEGDVAGEKDVA